MLQKLQVLFLLFLITLTSFAQVANKPSDLVLCDDDNDGFAQFDLSFTNAEVLGDQDPTDFTISYYLSLVDAENATNQVPSLFTNIANPQAIFIRLAANATGSADITEVILIVNPSPIFSIDDITYCTGDALTIDTGLNTVNYSFEWTYNGILIIGETQSTLFATMPGSYGVTVMDFITGCSYSSTAVLEAIDCTDTDEDGVIDSDEDINENGNLDDDDTDNDDIPNYLDDDDDGDTVDTLTEITMNSGRTNTVHPFIDTDDDTIENYLDEDDDGDNVLTIDEDYNGNGDPTDDDTNMNSIPDYLDSAVALSLNDFSLNSFSMFPNPAKESVTIKLNSNSFENVTLKVYDIQGKQILEQAYTQSNSVQIDVSGLQSGLYFVELRNGNYKKIEKLIRY